MYRQCCASTQIEEPAAATNDLRMDAVGHLCRLYNGLAGITVLKAAGGQPPCSVLPDHVPRLWAHDDQNYPGTPHSPTLPILDHYAGTHDRRCFACQSSLFYHPWYNLWADLRKFRAVVSSCVFCLRRGCVRKMGASCHHEHMQLSWYQLLNNSQENGREEREIEWYCQRSPPRERSQRLSRQTTNDTATIPIPLSI